MISIVKGSALAALCAVTLFMGLECTNSRALSREEHDPLKFEYDSFAQVSSDCLSQLRDSVEKKFGPEYMYKSTILSREKPYREAMFTRVEAKSTDSAIVVKFDSLCNVKRIYRSLMTFTGEQ